MKLMAVICEYNPFHNGHQFQLNTQKELLGADGIIGVMSGSFVQRGEPALLDKWARAEMALSCGVDLVLELPVLYSLMSAEGFARGGVSLLGSLGVSGYLAFGSECGDASSLMDEAKLCKSDAYKIVLQKALAEGNSYPRACQLALDSVCGSKTPDADSRPNDILGIEYCKAILEAGANLTPSAIKRLGAHDSDTPMENCLSATGIRNRLAKGEDVTTFMPKDAFAIIQREIGEGRGPVNTDRLSDLIRFAVLQADIETLKKISGISEGLENRIIQAVRNEKSFTDIALSVKTKRYPLTRIKRVLLSILLGMNAQDEKISPQYARVLGFTEKGSKILRELKKTSQIPIITKTADAVLETEDAKRLFELDTKATNLYSLLYPNQEAGQFGMDFLRSPIKKP